MFKLFFILSIVIASASANAIETVSLSDASFNVSTIVESENIINDDFDNSALFIEIIVQPYLYSQASLQYSNPDIKCPTFQNFQSRAPPESTCS
jgi:hypothetical protein